MNPANGQLINVDDQQKQHLTQIANHVSQATNQPTAVSNVQPVFEQEPLDDQTKLEAENFEEEQNEHDPKFSSLFPGLRKSIRTTRAANFLGKKIEWMKKRNGGEVGLK